MANPLKKLRRYTINSLNAYWSNKYVFEKFATQTASSFMSAYESSTSDEPDRNEVVSKGTHLWESTSLCSRMIFGGEAMAPAITSQPRFRGGGGGAGGESCIRSGGGLGLGDGVVAVKNSEKPMYNLLLVRQLMYPEFLSPEFGNMSSNPLWHTLLWFPRRAHVGDVVAFTHPNPVDPSLPGRILVRRVVALEGDVVESSGSSSGSGGVCRDGGDESTSESAESESESESAAESFVIPKGHAWVLADNEDLPLADVPDSRTFGPLRLSHVLGRVVYALRSATDHGVVQNSAAAAAVDQPVLLAELHVESLAEELQDFASGTRSFRRVDDDDDDDDD